MPGSIEKVDSLTPECTPNAVTPPAGSRGLGQGGVWPWPRVGWACEHAGRLWVWGGERNSHILEIADSEADIQPDIDSISQMP